MSFPEITESQKSGGSRPTITPDTDIAMQDFTIKTNVLFLCFCTSSSLANWNSLRSIFPLCSPSKPVFFGSTSPAEEREFTFATCVPARARLQVVGSACIPQDSPWAKEFFLQFLAIPKATPPMFSWEWCTVSLNSPWLPGAAQKASQPPTHQELPFAPGVAPPAQDSGASSRGTRGMHLLGKKEWA